MRLEFIPDLSTFMRPKEANLLALRKSTLARFEGFPKDALKHNFSLILFRFRLVRIRQKSRGQKFFFEKVSPNIRSVKDGHPLWKVLGDSDPRDTLF